VPKLLAIRNLISHPEHYGIVIDTLPNQPYFRQVILRSASMDIRSAARLAGISSDEFIALNAAFPRTLIRPDAPVNLLVPVARTDAFQRNLQTGSWDSWQPYSAQKGARPAAIARQYGIDLARLEEHNQLHVKHGKLVRDQTILVPVRNHGAIMEKTSTVPPAAAAPTRIEVQRGDTLFSIARVTVSPSPRSATPIPGLMTVSRSARPCCSPRERGRTRETPPPSNPLRSRPASLHRPSRHAISSSRATR